MAGLGGFSLLCGRYEGIDHRVHEHLVDGELSIGDVVLNGGEVAACLMIEAVVRLLPGAMGNQASPEHESFGASGLLEEPVYTRPAEFRGWPVPEVLRGGDHGRIDRWRRAQALHRTLRYRPDLVEARGGLSEADRSRWLEREGQARITAHPLTYVGQHVRGVVRMLGPGHDEFLQLTGLQRGSAAARVIRALAFAQLAVIYAGFMLTLWRRPTGGVTLAAAILFLYVALIGGPEMYPRFRMPLMPFLAAAAGVALSDGFRSRT